jgi:magnesium-transporting ATPase (P-type)
LNGHAGIWRSGIGRRRNRGRPQRAIRADRAIRALAVETLCSRNGRFETGIRSPLDAAILRQAAADVTGYRKIEEIPFDFERRRLSVVVEAPDSAGRRLLITKGAPEPILAR